MDPTDDELLRDARRELDQLDEELVALLARRAAVVRALFEQKRARSLPLFDEAREGALLEARGEAGARRGLPRDAVRGVFRAVLALSRALREGPA